MAGIAEKLPGWNQSGLVVLRFPESAPLPALDATVPAAQLPVLRLAWQYDVKPGLEGFYTST